MTQILDKPPLNPTDYSALAEIEHTEASPEKSLSTTLADEVVEPPSDNRQSVTAAVYRGLGEAATDAARYVAGTATLPVGAMNIGIDVAFALLKSPPKRGTVVRDLGQIIEDGLYGEGSEYLLFSHEGKVALTAARSLFKRWPRSPKT